jgi:hypothetical protein
MSVTQEECGVDFSDDKLGMGDTLRMYYEMYRGWATHYTCVIKWRGMGNTLHVYIA